MNKLLLVFRLTGNPPRCLFDICCLDVGYIKFLLLIVVYSCPDHVSFVGKRVCHDTCRSKASIPASRHKMGYEAKGS